MISVRSRFSPSPCATIARSLCSPAAPRDLFNESRGVVEGHERYAMPTPEAFGCLTGRNGKLAPNAKSVAGFESCPRDLSLNSSQPFAMSGQLASSGFIVVARSFYSGAHFQSSRFNENPSRNDSDLLPGVFCRVRASSPHVGHINMRGLSGEQIRVAKGESHV